MAFNYVFFQNLWNGMYLRWIIDPNPESVAREKISEIIERNKSAKSHVLQLRRKLQELEAEAEKLGITLY